ncbi:hypothetical protein RJ142_CDS0062 [Klebsiella phage EKq1]|nr:hypothetical protein RJ142_CDS0062 [Klebsiella phage EKq1]
MGCCSRTAKAIHEHKKLLYGLQVSKYCTAISA